MPFLWAFCKQHVALMEFKDQSPDNVQYDSPNSESHGNVCCFYRSSVAAITRFKWRLCLQPQDKIFVTGNRIEIVLHNNVRPQVIKSMMMIGAGKLPTISNILQDVRRKSVSRSPGLSIANELNSLAKNSLTLCRPWRRTLKTFF